MINKQLINPESIVIVGGSNDINKPGGKILKNIIDNNYKGKLFVANPKESEIQGIKSYQNMNDLPNCDLAILAIAAKFCPDTVELLAKTKNTRAFIILSAGFSEESEEGHKLEDKIVETINSVGGCLIGPNCIGVMNVNHTSVFTYPIPKFDKMGCDFITGSGATACFILESGIPKGIRFNSVYSVGNSAQMGVEEVLKYLDETYVDGESSKVKILYIENIQKPDMLLKHASSLIRKGCKIAAIKAGSSEAGSRAASSHTGALASSDSAVNALFQKAGIVRCNGKEDLLNTASIFMHKELKGKNIAIITHAGGPAVMLTDALSNGGLNVPKIEGEAAQELLTKLFAGSSVANPIDFLATGTAEQLGTIIDYVDNRFDNIDGMAVIFGTPGLFRIFDVYDVLHNKMMTCNKPIFPILPSTLTAKEEVDDFLSKGHINFQDEVSFGNALAKIYYTPKPAPEQINLPEIDKLKIRAVIDNCTDGYISPENIQQLLDAAGIERTREYITADKAEAIRIAEKIGYPLVMKVVGPVHKSDVGGVVLNIKDKEAVAVEFDRMIQIKDTTSIMLQEMMSGFQLFAGANFEPKFGHQIMFGLGGIFIEVLKDVSSALSPLTTEEALRMIRSIKSYKIIQGVRGQEPISEQKLAEILVRLSTLLEVAPEIIEIDLNPLLSKGEKIVAVDARINVKKV